MTKTILNQEQKEYISKLLLHANVKNPKIKKMLVHVEEHETCDIDNITTMLSPSFKENYKKKLGITFTPIKIVKLSFAQLANSTSAIDKILNFKIADLAAGNGAFFVGLFLYLKQRKVFSLKKFIETNIFAYELMPENIEYMEIIFSVIIEYFGEDSTNTKFNFYVGDTLERWTKGYIKNNFDLIIGNPPYVKQQNIPDDQRKFLLKNFDSIHSNYNLYYAFIELSMKLIGKKGTAILLVPNYLLKIKSANYLRNMLLNQKYIEKVIDFEFSKLFDGIDTYSMILQLHYNSKNILFKKQISTKIEKDSWTPLNYNNISTNSINLVDNKEQFFLNTIKKQPNKLIISTGIATLKDKLYLVDPKNNNENFFEKKIDNNLYRIDRQTVVPITRGSGTSALAVPKKQYIIYPYNIVNGKAYLMNQEQLLNSYPNTYQYLKSIKKELLSRSGKYDEKDWYKYGRSQSLTRFEPKIIFPTNSIQPKFHYLSERSLLYNGYAIYGIENHKSTSELLQALELILNSSLTQKFMKLVSYYIGGGYLSYQKKYLEQLKIPNLSPKDIQNILSLRNDSSKIDKLVYNLYGLTENINCKL